MKKQTKRQDGSYIWSHHEETGSERKLAQVLGKAGIGFSREVPVKGFTVDFLVDQWLVIEVDGESHLTKERVRKDASRQKIIEDAGFTVVRIPASDLSSAGDQNRWVKRIKEILSSPPYKKSDGFQNEDYRRQLEAVRKALLAGERERLRRESLAYEGVRHPKHAGNRHPPEEETMEGYFGQSGEDFAALLMEYDQKPPVKDIDAPKRPRGKGKRPR